MPTFRDTRFLSTKITNSQTLIGESHFSFAGSSSALREAPFSPAGANSKSKCECREGGSRVKDVPIVLTACGRDNVANNAAGPGHGAEPIFFLCVRGRRHNLGDRLAKLGDADRPAGLADALEEREAGRLEFRDSYFIHDTSKFYLSQGP
jgi:hypothetical protein